MGSKHPAHRCYLSGRSPRTRVLWHVDVVVLRARSPGWLASRTTRLWLCLFAGDNAVLRSMPAAGAPANARRWPSDGPGPRRASCWLLGRVMSSESRVRCVAAGQLLHEHTGRFL